MAASELLRMLRDGVDHRHDIDPVPERGQHHGSANDQAHDHGYDSNWNPVDRL
jgi:hypothetical protein